MASLHGDANMNWLERFDKHLAVASGLFAAASTILTFFSQLTAAPVIAVVCGALFLFLLSKLERGSSVRNPAMMQLRAANPEHLLGRKEDVQVIEELCMRRGTVVLVGQSGAGKTSLLKAGLMPLQRNSRCFFPLYLDRWDDVDWEAGVVTGAIARPEPRQERPVRGRLVAGWQI